MTIRASTPHMSRRGLLVAVSGMAAAGLLAACGGAAPASPTTQPQAPAPEQKPAAQPTPQPAAQATAKPAAPAATPPSAQPTTKPAAPAATPAVKSNAKVAVRLFLDYSEVDRLKDSLPSFRKEHPNVDLIEESAPGDDYLQKLQTLAAGGQLPDVVYLSEAFGWHRRSAKTGTLLPIDDLVKSENYDLSPFYKAAISSITYEGKLWGLPYKANSGQNLLFVNVDAVSATGLKVPNADTTLDDLVALAVKGTKRSGNQVEMWGLIPFIKGAGHHMTTFPTRMFGGEVLSEDGTKCLMSTEPAKQAMRWVYDLLHKHQCSPSLKVHTMKDPRIADHPLRGPVLDAITGAEPARLTANFRDSEYWRAAVQGLEPLWLGDAQPTDKFFSDLNADMQKILDKSPA